MPSLGWDRAYRSGDLVVNDPAGLLFGGRADDQVKLGGRRIELGEIDSALLAVPGVVGAAAAVRRTAAGNQLLVGYVATDAALRPGPGAWSCSGTRCRPRWCRGSPWSTRCPPGPRARSTATRCPGRCRERPSRRGARAARHRGLARRALARACSAPTSAARPTTSSTSAAAASPRPSWSPGSATRFPEVAVGDVYEHPTVGALAGLPRRAGRRPARPPTGRVPPTPLKTQAGQVVATLLLRALAGPRWLVWVGIGSRLLADAPRLDPAARSRPGGCWPLGWLVFVTPPGRMLLAAAGRPAAAAHASRPGDHPRGGKVHLRLWLAQRVVDELGATGLAGAPYMTWYARLLGAEVGRDVDLHSVPPVTGHAPARRRLLDRARGRPERLLGRRRRGPPRAGPGRRRGPGSARAACSARAPTSARTPRSRPARRSSARCPTASTGPAPRPRGSRSAPAARGPTGRRRSRAWVAAYGAVAVLLSCLPILAVLAGAALPVAAGRRPDVVRRPARACSAGCRCSALVGAGRARGCWCWVVVRRGRRSASGRACTRCAAAPRWRCGRRCGCSTTPAPGCSRSTPRA